MEHSKLISESFFDFYLVLPLAIGAVIFGVSAEWQLSNWLYALNENKYSREVFHVDRCTIQRIDKGRHETVFHGYVTGVAFSRLATAIHSPNEEEIENLENEKIALHVPVLFAPELKGRWGLGDEEDDLSMLHVDFASTSIFDAASFSLACNLVLLSGFLLAIQKFCLRRRVKAQLGKSIEQD